jgi:hypothetical protein
MKGSITKRMAKKKGYRENATDNNYKGKRTKETKLQRKRHKDTKRKGGSK